MNPIVLSALGNHLWQSTVVTALAGLLALMLKKQSACVRYWVWFTASVKFLVPFSALIALGGAMRWPVAKPVVTPPSVVVVATEITEPFVSLSVIKQSTDAAMGGYVPAALFIAWLVGFVTVTALWVRSWFRMRAIIRGASPLVIPPNTLAMASPALLEPSVFGAFLARVSHTP